MKIPTIMTLASFSGRSLNKTQNLCTTFSAREMFFVTFPIQIRLRWIESKA